MKRWVCNARKYSLKIRLFFFTCSITTTASVENKERHYTNLRTQRNLGNNCPDDVVDSLLLGVRTAGVPLCKRYYALKKNILKQTQGLETFRWSDRNAPIDISGAGTEDAKIPWEECVKIVEKGVCYIVLCPFHIALFGVLR